MDEIGVIDGDSMIAMATDSMKPITEEIVKNCIKDISKYICFLFNKKFTLNLIN